jgi:hypothetical protein
MIPGRDNVAVTTCDVAVTISVAVTLTVTVRTSL